MSKQKHLDKILKDILEFLSVDPEIMIENPNENIYTVTLDGDDLNFLIGHGGQSLQALQNILHLSTFREFSEPTTIIVDINGYRDRKTERLRDLAKDFIDRVRSQREDIPLPIMDPWERRQVHTFVSEYDDIMSESEGTGRDRRIVLKLKSG